MTDKSAWQQIICVNHKTCDIIARDFKSMDVVDLFCPLWFKVFHRNRDGIHWDPKINRVVTNTVLTHYALSLKKSLPTRNLNNFALEKRKLMAQASSTDANTLNARLEHISFMADQLITLPLNRGKDWKTLPMKKIRKSADELYRSRVAAFHRDKAERVAMRQSRRTHPYDRNPGSQGRPSIQFTTSIDYPNNQGPSLQYTTSIDQFSGPFHNPNMYGPPNAYANSVPPAFLDSFMPPLMGFQVPPGFQIPLPWNWPPQNYSPPDPSGFHAHGYPSHGYPSHDGYPHHGYLSHNGYPPEGFPPHGYSQSYPSHGFPPQGYPPANPYSQGFNPSHPSCLSVRGRGDFKKGKSNKRTPKRAKRS